MAPVEKVDVHRLEWPTIGMTPEEAAQAMRVHPRTIEDMLREGKIPGRKVGRQWRLAPDALNQWLGSYEPQDAGTNCEKD